MQNTLKTFVLIVLFAVASFSTVEAQKYGHMNLGNLLEQLPEMKAADAELETYRVQLANVGQQMVQEFETAMKAAQAGVDGGEWSPSRIQEEQAKLAEMEQKIRIYEQEVINQVTNKRQELLAPILQKAETAIKAVAEENGYQMIFDTSIFNAVLFAKDSEDVLEKVKAKLM